MPNDKPAKAAADAMAKELKTSLAKDRPRTWKPVLALVTLCSLILGLMAWWLLPRALPPALQVVAFDGVFTPEEKRIVRGQLFALPGVEPAPNLRGHSIVFDDQQSCNILVVSDDKGHGAAQWPNEDEPVAAFFVRFVDIARRQGSAKETGRLFIWPKDARIALVDADETLTDAADDAAPTALNAAVEDGWRIAYLSLASDKAHDFRQARSRLDNLVKLPKGPYLGRESYPASESIDTARRAVMQSLKAKFKGELVTIVQSADAAAACTGLGVRVIRLGDAATPTWAEVSLK